MSSSTVEALPPDARALRQARERARRWVWCEGSEHLTDNLVLLVSELVTNAVANATRGPVRMALSSREGVIRCEVTNAGTGEPVPKVGPPDAPSGRGLHLVDSVASRWGSTGVDGSTVVWFELDT